MYNILVPLGRVFHKVATATANKLSPALTCGTVNMLLLAECRALAGVSGHTRSDRYFGTSLCTALHRNTNSRSCVLQTASEWGTLVHSAKNLIEPSLAVVASKGTDQRSFVRPHKNIFGFIRNRGDLIDRSPGKSGRLNLPLLLMLLTLLCKPRQKLPPQWFIKHAPRLDKLINHSSLCISIE